MIHCPAPSPDPVPHRHSRAPRAAIRGWYVLLSIWLLIGTARAASQAENSTNAPRRRVMTWVPPYAVSPCRTRLDERYDGIGPQDVLTHLGLQFWVPTREGGVARTGPAADTGDASVAAFRDWGRARGIRVLLCIYNGAHGWDWELGKAAFAANSDRFATALAGEVERLELDGVDLDIEGNGKLEADRDAYLAFVRKLSGKLREHRRILTADTFAYLWHAPNQSWWPELLPWVDALTTMGYDEIGAKAPDWRSFEAQKRAAGVHAAKLLLGLPSHLAEWRGSPLEEHLAWFRQNPTVGVAIWDAQLGSPAWRQASVWRALSDTGTGAGAAVRAK